MRKLFNDKDWEFIGRIEKKPTMDPIKEVVFSLHESLGDIDYKALSEGRRSLKKECLRLRKNLDELERLLDEALRNAK